MKRYKSHKIVQAGKIIKIQHGVKSMSDPLGQRVGVIIIEGGEQFAVDWTQQQLQKADVGGYLVQYGDGYLSYSPANAFEEGYTELPEPLPPSHPVQQIADAVGATIKHVEHRNDGSGSAILSTPLPSNHWLTQPGYNVPPMPFRRGTDDPSRKEWVDKIWAAGRYAVRCATMNGTEDDFDPDALVQNLVIGMLGYFTPNGLSHDSDANPENPVPVQEKAQREVPVLTDVIEGRRSKIDHAIDSLKYFIAALEKPSTTTHAPRVPEERINILQASLTYDTAHVPNTNSTVATARLPGGFVVAIGHNACVSAANFNAEEGRKYAIEDATLKARDKLWELEGYVLGLQLAGVIPMSRTRDAAQELALEGQPPHRVRVFEDHWDAAAKLNQLRADIDSIDVDKVDGGELMRMRLQFDALKRYVDTLAARIVAF